MVVQGAIGVVFLVQAWTLLRTMVATRLEHGGPSFPDRATRPLPNLAAIMPCTLSDLHWLLAKALTCARTLDETNVRVVLILTPRAHIAPLRAGFGDAGVDLPRHWHFVPEDEVLPPRPKGSPWVPGWNLQQILKLMGAAHPLIADGPDPIDNVLVLDSDVLCSRGWKGAYYEWRDYPPDPNGTALPAPGTLPEAFIAEDGRILTCQEHLGAWFGDRHLVRTARHWGFTAWLPLPGTGQGASRPGGRARRVSHVMGWTPQILSVAALEELRRLLLERNGSAVAPDLSPAQRFYALLAASRNVTEYFSYFLALDDAGLWDEYHENLCPVNHIEWATDRCPRLFNTSKDGRSHRASMPHPQDILLNSSGVGGCLKVRADCTEEMILELDSTTVPFVVVNDHHVTGEEALQIAREFAEARVAGEAGRAPPVETFRRKGRMRHARDCCAACSLHHGPRTDDAGHAVCKWVDVHCEHRRPYTSRNAHEPWHLGHAKTDIRRGVAFSFAMAALVALLVALPTCVGRHWRRNGKRRAR